MDTLEVGRLLDGPLVVVVVMVVGLLSSERQYSRARATSSLAAERKSEIGDPGAEGINLPPTAPP